MSTWPRHPFIYEINTFAWLQELSKRTGSTVTLGTVPACEWDALAARGFDAVWLMGVWERSPAGVAIATRNPNLVGEFERCLPDYSAADLVGSAYCVRRYVVDERLGGAEGLAQARTRLAERGVRLILDFVPNHVAPDHPWVGEHPDFFIHADYRTAHTFPDAFRVVHGMALACGKDPYCPPWTDVLQLNAFKPGLRLAVRDTLLAIASQCDGVRCDMAMLVVNAIFARTWGERVGPAPATEYWRDLIASTKAAFPGFLFMAECYWDLEWELQQQGFDFCYDKRFYDRLEHESPESVRLHLGADMAYQGKLLRFIENHDEPRAAATFVPARHRAAAVLTLSLPGARLLHEGQLEGRRVKMPVFLGRRPDEPVDFEMAGFYQELLAALHANVFREGEWRLSECWGWLDNLTCRNIVACSWTHGTERRLIVVNLGGEQAQARVEVPWDDLRGGVWRLVDRPSGQSYERDGFDMRESGLYVDLPPHGAHIFEIQPAWVHAG